jgi:signal transduction histidine kinase
VWRDWLLVGVLVPVALLEGVVRPDMPWRALSVILTISLVPMLLWRRTRPLLMVAIAFGICALAGVLTSGEPPGTNAMAFVLLLPYALFRWGSGREAAIGAVIMFGKIAQSIVGGEIVGGNIFGALAILIAAMALGGALRYRAGARQRELAQVKLMERERLARDLHDSVAHHVSAIAIRAQAGLATAETRPDAATDALRLIEAEASRSLTEMRTIVRALRRSEQADPANGAQPMNGAHPASGAHPANSAHRADPAGVAAPADPAGPADPVRPATLADPADLAELAPGPQVADLEKLAANGHAGPSVDVELAGDLDDLPPSVSAALYRLAQESVTNARRHARHATRIEVRVAADDRSVRLRVSDDGDTSLIKPAASPGYGLVGMVERATLLGGTCRAGPDPGRGWTVTAVLPRAGWAR